MTLKELKLIIDSEINENNENIEVCIPNNKPSIGGVGVTKIGWVGQGMDWDCGRFLIIPEVRMYEKEVRK